MVIARRNLISDGAVGAFHAISRTVRQSWLMGVDPLADINSDHRKLWIKNRLIHLSKQFSMEVCGYAILSNHTSCAQEPTGSI